MASATRIIRAQDCKARPWRNDGGQTRELLAWPGTAESAGQSARSWQLRISLADVERSGPFSAYPGVERWFAVVEGAGVRLQLAGRELRLRVGDAPLHFSGDTAVDCDLVAGPTRDLNLMTASGAGQMLAVVAGQLWRSDLPQRGLFTRLGGTWADDRGHRHALPGQTLLWLDDAAGCAWDFLPAAAPTRDHGGDGPPGWWLGYAPVAAMADQ